MESPSATSPKDDWSKCLIDYDADSKKCVVKCNSFFVKDQTYKDLQSKLYKLLTRGDDIWEEMQECTRSSVRRQLITDLQSAIRDMYVNLEEQENAIVNVESSMHKSVRQLEKTLVNMRGLTEQVQAVKINLEDRVRAMENMQPKLRSRDSSPTRRR